MSQTQEFSLVGIVRVKFFSKPLLLVIPKMYDSTESQRSQVGVAEAQIWAYKNYPFANGQDKVKIELKIKYFLSPVKLP